MISQKPKIISLRLKLQKFIKKEPKLSIILLITVLIAIFFRTYNYFDRIYVYADNSLFVLAAYFAKDNLKIPQIGPFAQAPFFTGPWWLWILELLFIFPFGPLTPWYFMWLVSIIFIVLIYFAGGEIGGKRLGALSAFLAAISTAQIDNSFMTWNAAADPYLGLLSILFFLKYSKEKKPIYIFLLGFSVSLAITIHFQTFLLSPLILIALLLTKPKIKNLVALAIGVLIPLLPFLYFDLRFNWFETKRIIDYVTIGQYRIYVPNRWLTYAGVYWPKTWAWIIGGKAEIGYLIIGLLCLLTLIRLKDYKKYWNYYLIAFSFVVSVVLFRYYRGERFFYYTNFAHALVLLLTAWVTLEVYQFKKTLGVILVSIIIIFSVSESLKNFKPRVVTYSQVNKLIAEIYQKYPNAKFDIYECPFNGSLISTPVSYIMYYDGRNSLDGIKIGVCNHELKLSWREVTETEIDKEFGYQHKSTPNIYTEMTEWWKRNPPKELY